MLLNCIMGHVGSTVFSQGISAASLWTIILNLSLATFLKCSTKLVKYLFLSSLLIYLGLKRNASSRVFPVSHLIVNVK